MHFYSNHAAFPLPIMGVVAVGGCRRVTKSATTVAVCTSAIAVNSVDGCGTYGLFLALTVDAMMLSGRTTVKCNVTACSGGGALIAPPCRTVPLLEPQGTASTTGPAVAVAAPRRRLAHFFSPIRRAFGMCCSVAHRDTRSLRFTRAHFACALVRGTRRCPLTVAVMTAPRRG